MYRVYHGRLGMAGWRKGKDVGYERDIFKKAG
jgi:hypothetical protein